MKAKDLLPLMPAAGQKFLVLMFSHFLPAFLDNTSQMLVLLSIFCHPGRGIISIFKASIDDSPTLQIIIAIGKRQERKIF